jgi:hypothetical protein
MTTYETVPWEDFPAWKKYGIEHEYDKRTRSSLHGSKSREERSWYFKGNRNSWIWKFPFKVEPKIKTNGLDDLLRDYAQCDERGEKDSID